MNTYDLVVQAATAGVEPDDDDLDAVKAPPGTDPATFRRDLVAKASEIVQYRRQGLNDTARKLAAEASAEYLRPFQDLLPTPAAGVAEDVRAIGARMFERN